MDKKKLQEMQAKVIKSKVKSSIYNKHEKGEYTGLKVSDKYKNKELI